MDQLVNVNVTLPPKSTAEMEKELEQSGALLSGGSGATAPKAPQTPGFPGGSKRPRASRPMLLLSNLGALPYVIRSAVWPSSRKTSET